MPATTVNAGIGPGGADAAVRPDPEYVECAVQPSNGGNRGVGARGSRRRDRKWRVPAATVNAGIGPGGADAAVWPDPEYVECAVQPSNRGDRRVGARGPRRRDREGRVPAAIINARVGPGRANAAIRTDPEYIEGAVQPGNGSDR